jgi:hypothetical protein
MFKLIKFVLVVVILTTLAIAEPNRPETAEVQQRSNLVPAAESQQTKSDQIEIYNLLDSKIISLEKQIEQTKEEIDKKFDYQIQCNEKAITSVNTSISGATLAVTILTIVVAFMGVGLGIYISRQVRDVTHIAKQSKTILDDHIKIRDEVRDLDAKIKSNMSELYDDLKEEETRKLVERLCEVPEDIANLNSTLASRCIPEELFPKVKKAYQSLACGMGQHKGEYHLLFFQHFPGLAIFDKDLQNEIEDDYSRIMRFCFKNDIMRTSEKFIKAVIKEGAVPGFSDKIKKYFIALRLSAFGNFPELHQHIYNVLATKENRFDLYSILSAQNELGDIAGFYGQYLLSDYKGHKGGRNNGAEDKILAEIAKTVKAKKEDSQPEPPKS